MDEYRMKRGTLRILLPGRTGAIEINTELSRADGAPRIRVDVTSDAERYGPADDGMNYTVENGYPGPGVVFLTGARPDGWFDPAASPTSSSPASGG